MILRWTAISSSTTAFFFFSFLVFRLWTPTSFFRFKVLRILSAQVEPLLFLPLELSATVSKILLLFFDTHETIILENNREKQLSLALVRDSDGFWAPSKMSSVRDLDANTLDSYFADQFASFALCQSTHIVRICFGTFLLRPSPRALIAIFGQAIQQRHTHSYITFFACGFCWKRFVHIDDM